MNRIAIVIATFWLSACQLSPAKPQTGSETHFLARCSRPSDCSDPYACVCGVCSVRCAADDSCALHADRARCVSPRAASEPVCDGAGLMCDVECTSDGQCVGLPQASVCSQGRCREATGSPPPLTEPDAGLTDAAPLRDAAADARGPTDDVGPSATEGGAVAASALCDGSDAVRAGFTVRGGGPLEPTFELTNPYGHRFAFIDGRCRYFAGSNHMQGIAQGTLSELEAQRFSEETGWSMLPSWRAHTDDACPDGAFTMLMREGATASCSCGCDDDAPTGLADAVAAGARWAADLETRGVRLTGSVRAAAFVLQGPDPQPVTPAAWPLARSMASIPGLISPAGGSTAGARFDAAEDASALRALRANTAGQSMSRGVGFIRVTDTTGTAYNLYVVDVLPDVVAAAIAAFETRAAAP